MCDRSVSFVARELVQEYLRSQDPEIITQFAIGFSDFERKSLLATILWMALRNADWRLADACIAAGYSIAMSEQGDVGAIYSAIAAFGDRADVVDWLLQHGAGLEHRGHNNWTPLMAAARGGHEMSVATLLLRGSDPNARTIIDDNMTVLMIAATSGSVVVTQSVLNGGARREDRDARDRTAIDIAESLGFVQIVELIRSSEPGAELGAINDE